MLVRFKLEPHIPSLLSAVICLVLTNCSSSPHAIPVIETFRPIEAENHQQLIIRHNTETYSTSKVSVRSKASNNSSATSYNGSEKSNKGQKTISDQDKQHLIREQERTREANDAEEEETRAEARERHREYEHDRERRNQEHREAEERRNEERKEHFLKQHKEQLQEALREKLGK